MENNCKNENLKNDNEIVCVNENNNKKIIKNIVLVAISNILTLLAGVLVGFVIPKIMLKADYGYYKTYTLYFGYIGLFPLGFIDGIYLLYAGKKYNDLDKRKFRCYSRFLFVFQLIISLILMILSIPFFFTDFGIILFFLGINVVFNSITGYFQIISQITGRFKELSFRNTIKAILTTISVVVLVILYYLKVIDNLKFSVYIVITFSISVLLSIWYLFTYRDIVFGDSASIREEKSNIFKYFKIGIPLLIANVVSHLILTIDRQFVSVLFDIEIYATYAFAYNMLSLITTVISAISTVLYPSIKQYDENELKNNYSKLLGIISILVSFALLSYFPLDFIVTKWLPKYIDSLEIFRVILPGLILSSCISLIMFNYYKAFDKTFNYFIKSVIILVLSVLSNLFAYFVFKNTISISIASISVFLIWYIIVDLLIFKKYKCYSSIKNFAYIIAIMISFYLITYFISNVFIGFGIYFIIFILLTISFYFNLIKKSKFFRR